MTGSSVGVVKELRAGRPRNHGSARQRRKMFYLLRKVQTVSGAHTVVYLMGTCDSFFSGGKVART